MCRWVCYTDLHLFKEVQVCVAHPSTHTYTSLASCVCPGGTHTHLQILIKRCRCVQKVCRRTCTPLQVCICRGVQLSRVEFGWVFVTSLGAWQHVLKYVLNSHGKGWSNQCDVNDTPLLIWGGVCVPPRYTPCQRDVGVYRWVCYTHLHPLGHIWDIVDESIVWRYA